jgi:adenylate kinase
MSVAKPIRMIIMGAPGSGKGTLTSRLLKKFPQIHSLSTGDVLRKEIANGSSIGETAKTFIAKGELLPDNFMAQLVQAELNKNQWLDGKTSFLFDGFPRTVSQAEALEPVLNPHDSNINFVVELDVPPEIILDRIANRWVHSSGRVYNLQYNPPKIPFKDDVTGEPLFKRPDDNPETFKIRLDKYFAELEPIRNYYEKKGIYHVVRGQSSDIIFPQLYDLVQKQLE